MKAHAIRVLAAISRLFSWLVLAVALIVVVLYVAVAGQEKLIPFALATIAIGTLWPVGLFVFVANILFRRHDWLTCLLGLAVVLLKAYAYLGGPN